MAIKLFNQKVQYHKNGVFWFQKLLSRVVGERYYELFRIERRIFAAKIWYRRQEFLYHLNIHYPDIAYFLGTFPKIDSSHGIPNHQPWETFRDWQENTPNSDGWYAWVIALFCLWFSLYTAYVYLIPHYWADRDFKYEPDLRYRIRDYYCTSNFEDNIGNAYFEWAYQPHLFHTFRQVVY